MITARQIRRRHTASKLIWKVWTLFVVVGLLIFAFLIGYLPVMGGAWLVERELDHANRAISRINTLYTSTKEGVKNFGKATKNLADGNIVNINVNINKDSVTVEK